MRNRRLGPLALALTLLLASTAGLASHDHVAELERASYDCAFDHERHHEAVSPISTPELRAAGDEHRHQCLGCYQSSQRILFSTAGVSTGLGSARQSAAVIRSLPRPVRSWASRTLRGPPSA